MTTIKDKIRDCVVQYEEDTRNGEASDPDVLVEAIWDVLKSYFN
jgi:hypothetical protein